MAFSFLLIAPGVFAYGGGIAPSDLSAMTYGGRAYGVATYVPWVGGSTFASTGSLPAEGGVLVADFAPVSTSVAEATVFLSYARGFDDVAMSEVATSDVVLLAGTAFEVVANFAYSRTVATCWGVDAAGQVSGLSVGGMPIWVGDAPNQVYSVPGVFTLVMNEQRTSWYDGVQSVTANALHAWFSGIEVVVSSARSSISCGETSSLVDPLVPLVPLSVGSVGVASTGGGDVEPQCGFPGCDKQPNDFVTGGGWFRPRTPWGPNARVNFGFNAGPRPGNPTLKGHLNLIDHGNGFHVQGVTVDSYTRAGDPDDVCRNFRGDAKLNGQFGFRYNAGVCDYGEPGRDDRFVIQVFQNGVLVYFADNRDFSKPPERGDLDGGNIQLHRFRA